MVIIKCAAGFLTTALSLILCMISLLFCIVYILKMSKSKESMFVCFIALTYCFLVHYSKINVSQAVKLSRQMLTLILYLNRLLNAPLLRTTW